MNSNPFRSAIDQRLEQIHPGLSCSLDRLSDLDSTTISRTIDLLLGYACCSQNHAYINEGRRRLALISPDLFDSIVRESVERVLDLTDEWEFRRLVELLELLKSPCCREFLAFGLSSDSAEIREAAADLQTP